MEERDKENKKEEKEGAEDVKGKEIMKQEKQKENVQKNLDLKELNKVRSETRLRWKVSSA